MHRQLHFSRDYDKSFKKRAEKIKTDHTTSQDRMRPNRKFLQRNRLTYLKDCKVLSLNLTLSAELVILDDLSYWRLVDISVWQAKRNQSGTYHPDINYDIVCFPVCFHAGRSFSSLSILQSGISENNEFFTANKYKQYATVLFRLTCTESVLIIIQERQPYLFICSRNKRMKRIVFFVQSMLRRLGFNDVSALVAKLTNLAKLANLWHTTSSNILHRLHTRFDNVQMSLFAASLIARSTLGTKLSLRR